MYLLLLFTNNTKNDSTVWIHKKDEYGLDARLSTTEHDSIFVSAFLIPGLEFPKKKSLVTFWAGRLGIKLKQGEKTWLLLVFDVPNKYNSASFHLNNAPSIKVSLPGTVEDNK